MRPDVSKRQHLADCRWSAGPESGYGRQILSEIGQRSKTIKRLALRVARNAERVTFVIK